MDGHVEKLIYNFGHYSTAESFPWGRFFFQSGLLGGGWGDYELKTFELNFPGGWGGGVQSPL